MKFKIKIEPEAYDDIQDAIDWYNKKQPGLGSKFHAEVKGYINKLKINPFFQVRYDDVRCLPLKIFPFMIHFTIDEAEYIVIIKAVFATKDNPKKWTKRK